MKTTSGFAFDEQSGQYIVTKAKPGIILKARDAKSDALKILNDLRNGKSCELDSLEVLDEIIHLATNEDKENFLIWTGTKHWSWDMLYRIRFERGLDPRPRISNEN